MSKTVPDPPNANVQAIARLEEQAIHRRSVGERTGATITRVAGSMVFVWVHVVWYAGWIGVNLDLVSGIPVFDPFPFSFLTLVVSLEAIFLSLFVLNSQNRMAREADRRGHLDFQVNLLAEQENTRTLEMLQRLCEHVGVPIPSDEELRNLSQKTDVDRLARDLARQLPDPQ